MVNKCVICNDLITIDNDSSEHVLPNAIGGRKKIKGFICRSCNSESGNDWDVELAKQLNPLSLFFNISRERGIVPSQVLSSISGTNYMIHPEGSMGLEKPIIKKTPIENGMEIKFSARDMREAKQILTGLKRKHPELDVDQALKSAQSVSSYTNDPIHMPLQFGGAKSGRSIVKSTLAIAYIAGIKAHECEKARNYLLDENAQACFGYYYEKDLLLNRPEGVVFHCVAVKGNPVTNLLLGYVELFGSFRVVVCLSDNYTGGDFYEQYSIDPISGKELNIEVDLTLTSDEIAAAYKYEKVPDGSIKAAMDKVIPLGINAAFEREQDRVITQAVDYAFAKCGIAEGEVLTPEKYKQFSGLIIEKLTPFLLRHLVKNPNDK